MLKFFAFFFFCFALVTPVQALSVNDKNTVLKAPSYLDNSSAEQDAKKFILPPLEKPTHSATATLASDPSQVFLLNDIKFSGNTVFSDKELKQVAVPYLNKMVSLPDLESLRFLLTQFYSSKGYMNSGVLLPDQHIQNGRVSYQVIEGNIAEIHISGNDGLHTDYITERLNISKDQVFNKKLLQKGFQYLLADPLIKRLNGQLKPSDKMGQAILQLDITREKPYHFIISLDNHHATSTGEFQGSIDSVIRNITGYGDSLQLGLNASEGSQAVNGMYFFPINANNTQVVAEFNYNNALVVESSLKKADIKSKYHALALGVHHPLIKQATQELSLDLMLGLRKNKTSFLGVGTPFSEGDEADGKSTSSAIRFSQNYTQRQESMVIALRSTFNVGINAFNATTHADNVADSRFLSWIGQVQIAKKVGESLGQIIAKTNIQLSNDKLLAVEKVSVGGPKSVRGYRANYLIKDNGVDASLEYHYPLLTQADKNNTVVNTVFFIDAGTAWDHKADSQRSSVSSAGLGFVLKRKNLSAEIFFAHPFKKANLQNGNYLQDEGISFRLSAEF